MNNAHTGSDGQLSFESHHLFANKRFAVDDTLLYIGLIRTVLERARLVVDVGCGRGSYADKEEAFNIFDLRGPGRSVVGIDVDPAARHNPYLNEFRHIALGHVWPLDDGTADLVVCDWTLEHVQDSEAFAMELVRVLRPGGVFIARSVNYYSLLSVVSRIVPNRRHAKVLESVQPDRKSYDVFPAYYRMNTRRRLQRVFSSQFDLSVASRPALENYLHAKHPFLARLTAQIERRLPESMQTAFVLCAYKREPPSS